MDFPRSRTTTLEQASAAADEKDSVAAKLAREAYLVGAGIVGGMKSGFAESAQHPLGTGLRLAGSIGIGLALTYAQRQAGLLRIGSQIAGAAFATSFMADLALPGRLGAVGEAVGDTWRSGRNLERNVGVMQDGVGRFAFDTGLLMAGGAAGAKLGRTWFPDRPTVSGIFKELSLSHGRGWNGRTFSEYESAFAKFPHKARRFVEMGKDSLTIELHNDRFLKIMKTPLPPGAGTRYFDLPILEHGRLSGGRIEYIIQPKAEVVTSRAVANRFADEVWRKGYNFWDRAPDQLGYYRGQLKLLDYNAVARRTVR